MHLVKINTQHIQGACGLPLRRDVPTILYKDNIKCITQLKGEYIKGDITKYISPKKKITHDFQKKREIDVQQVHSSDKLVDMFTKTLPTSTFEKLRYKLMRRL